MTIADNAYLHIAGNQYKLECLNTYVIALDVSPGSDHLILNEGRTVEEMREYLNLSGSYPNVSIVMSLEAFMASFPERHGHTNYIGPYVPRAASPDRSIG